MADPDDTSFQNSFEGGPGDEAADQSGHPDWSELPYNIGPSAGKLVGNVIFPITHPSQFVHGLYNIATDSDTRAAVGQFYKDRYGGLQNIRDTLISDPVGMAADLSAVLGGGEFALARVAGKAAKRAALSPFASAAEKAAYAAAPSYDTTNLAGKTAQVLNTTRKWTDPVSLFGKGVGAAAYAAGSSYNKLTGLLNQTGAETVSDAAAAGREDASSLQDTVRSMLPGGKAKTTSGFLDNLRGKVPLEKVVGELESGVQQAKEIMHRQYQQMFPRLDQPIDTTQIHIDWNNAANDLDPVTGTHGGGMSKLTPQSEAALKNAKDIIDQYTAKPKDQFVEDASQQQIERSDGSFFQPGNWHVTQEPQPRSVYQLDALKQTLGGLARESKDPQVQRVIGLARKSVDSVLDTHAPGYSDTMNAYSQAHDLLDDVKQTFGTGSDASMNTKVGKINRIYSTTAAGKRSSELMDQVENVTGTNYRPALAGQRMQSWLPGEGKLIPMIAEGVGMKEALSAIGTNLLSAKGIALGGLASPKLSGYMTYGANRAAAAIGKTFDAGIPTPWGDTGMPEPITLGRMAVQASRPAELATDKEEIERRNADADAGIE